MNIVVHTDGGARGNPGPAAVGILIEMINDKCQMPNEKLKTIKISKRIGETTNNVAEYTAVIKALEELIKRGLGKSSTIQFFLDSTLVVNQLNGLFKIKDARLRQLLFQIHALIQESGGEVSFTYVPREKNKKADLLVNKALDTLSFL